MIFVRRLDRYVMRQFVAILAIALAALTALTITVHLMDHVDVFLDHDAAWSDVGRYYAYSVPYTILLTLPMAVLVATILTIGELGRHGELTAMKASGISLYRLSAPIVGFALLLSGGVVVFGETVVPRLNERSNEIYEEQILDRGGDAENFRGNFVYQDADGYTYIVRSLTVGEQGSSAEQVEIQRRYDDGTFVRINAPRMIWEGSTRTWVLRDGELRYFPPPADGPGAAEADTAGGEAGRDTAAAAGTGAARQAPTPADTPPVLRSEERMFGFELLRSAHFEDSPQELLVPEKKPEEMGYVDLREYIAERDRLGAETLQERVDLHMKLAYPFASLIIAIFGVALVGSASHAGQQSATVGFGLALFLTIVFWGLLRVSQGIGYGGGLPPPWAAWLANGVFLVFGLALLVRART